MSWSHTLTAGMPSAKGIKLVGLPDVGCCAVNAGGSGASRGGLETGMAVVGVALAAPAWTIPTGACVGSPPTFTIILGKSTSEPSFPGMTFRS